MALLKIRSNPVTLILHFFCALVFSTIIGTLVQSQFNLIAIAQLTGGIGLGDWLATCWFDLLNFGPILAAILLPTLAGAFVLAALLERFYARSDYLLYFFIAALSLYVALHIINYFAPMPTLIAASRTLSGTLGLLASAGLGGVLFVYLRRRHYQHGSRK